MNPGGQGGTPYRTGITATSFLDMGLTNGATYYYRVSAANTAGKGPRSAEVSAKPTAPSGSISVVGRVATETSPYWGQLNVLVTNTAAITALTIQISVQKTPGIAYSGQYNNYSGGAMTMSNSQTSTAIV